MHGTQTIALNSPFASGMNLLHFFINLKRNLELKERLC